MEVAITLLKSVTVMSSSEIMSTVTMSISDDRAVLIVVIVVREVAVLSMVSTRGKSDKICRCRGRCVLDIGGSFIKRYSRCVDCIARSRLGQDERAGTNQFVWSV